MKKMILALGIIFCTLVVSGMVADDHQLFAQYPPPQVGCCKLRDWLGGVWKKTELNIAECEELNNNRDNLDDMFLETGYVWWDLNCE